jgi:hypothetical protein
MSTILSLRHYKPCSVIRTRFLSRQLRRPSSNLCSISERNLECAGSGHSVTCPPPVASIMATPQLFSSVFLSVVWVLSHNTRFWVGFRFYVNLFTKDNGSEAKQAGHRYSECSKLFCEILTHDLYIVVRTLSRSQELDLPIQTSCAELAGLATSG